MNNSILKIVVVILVLLYGCKSNDETEDACTILDWENSEYVLPYPVGVTYRVNQGNDSGFGHSGAYIYGYDFAMPIGSVVVASRAGEVTEVRNDNPDGVDLVLGNENLVKVLHNDGTTAAYSHLKQFSVLVSLGEIVQAGDTLGLSGNSGYTGNFPHLHFHVSNCDEPTLPGCTTLLTAFSNTRANECGLIQDEFYESLPY